MTRWLIACVAAVLAAPVPTFGSAEARSLKDEPAPAVQAEAAAADPAATAAPSAAATTASVAAAERAAAGADHAPGPLPASSAAGGAHEAAAPTVAALVAHHAQANGVPVPIAAAVVTIESRGNARASHAGALGLMQIKLATARAAGFSGQAKALFEPDINLRYGMIVLGRAYRAAGGDLCRTLMQYQSGHLATRMSAANRAYCTRAKALIART